MLLSLSVSFTFSPHFPQKHFRCHCCNFVPGNGFQSERGLEFNTGGAFYRQESATGRDLGVLAASLQKKVNGSLRVLDALCGCGIRSARYLKEAEADFVAANDGNESYGRIIEENLSRVAAKEEKRWVVTHLEANRVMTDYYMQKNLFDFIDVDSFGSDSSFLRSAISTLKFGGLLYVTSTDGFSSGGHRPHHSLAAYGAYVRPMPYSNEIGLRMLIGGVVREAALLGYHITPLFSYYAYHGPVFRVLLRLNRGKLHDSRHYGFIGQCRECGNSHEFSWDQLGQMSCSCSVSKVSDSLEVSGPLWTGPLHDGAYLTDMLDLAKQWGWIGCDGKDSLEKLIKLMVDESDPRLPFGYIKLDEMASRAKINTPPLRALMSAMHEKGYAASRSHITTNAIKTNCPMTEFISIAKELLQIQDLRNPKYKQLDPVYDSNSTAKSSRETLCSICRVTPHFCTWIRKIRKQHAKPTIHKIKYQPQKAYKH